MKLSKIILFFCCFLGLVSVVDAQFLFSGKITHAETGEELNFVNISIDNTLLGTTTGQNGAFMMVLADEYLGYKVSITAIGFEDYTMVLRKGKTKDLDIQLKSIAYEIEGVKVNEIDLWAYGCIKDALTRIKDNNIQGAHGLTLKYTSSITGEGIKDQRNASVILYDAKGYVKEDLGDSYASIGYEFTDYSRTKPLTWSVTHQLTELDFLLDMDWVRRQCYLFDEEGVYVYKLSKGQDTVLQGEKMWRILFELEEPNVNSTGDAQVEKASGYILIGQTSYGIYKMVFKGKSAAWSWSGKSVKCDGVAPVKGQELDYVYEVSFLRVGELLHLSSIDLQADYKNAQGKVLKEHTRIEVENVNKNAPKAISNRHYYIAAKD